MPEQISDYLGLSQEQIEKVAEIAGGFIREPTNLMEKLKRCKCFTDEDERMFAVFIVSSAATEIFYQKFVIPGVLDRAIKDGVVKVVGQSGTVANPVYNRFADLDVSDDTETSEKPVEKPKENIAGIDPMYA
jgi:hypothetical protein